MLTAAEMQLKSSTVGKARSLSEGLKLTQDDVAEILKVQPRSVLRWWSGETTPRRVSQRLLREFAYVLGELSKVLQPEAAKTWLLTPNRRLRHDSPADRIADGDYREVLALIEALADGVVM